MQWEASIRKNLSRNAQIHILCKVNKVHADGVTPGLSEEIDMETDH